MPNNSDRQRMLADNWTLENELCSLAGETSLAAALAKLKLVKLKDDFKLNPSADWVRGGGETYIFPFSVTTDISRRYIIKAMVAATPGVPPDEQLRHWLARRDLIVAAGVPVPRLHGAGSAILVEEFIEEGAIDRLRRQLLSKGPEAIDLSALESVVKGVFEAGFKPTNLLWNMRVDSAGYKWVDFGTDLGYPDRQKPSLNAVTALADELEAFVWKNLRRL
jgi:hypothetical protein